MHTPSEHSSSSARSSVCVIVPVGGGSGLRGRTLTNWMLSTGAAAKELTQLKFSDLRRTLCISTLVLNEGLQGVSRRALKTLKGLRGRRIRVVAVVRSFRFAKSDWGSVHNSIDLVVCVSESLQGLFLDLFPHYRAKCCVIREYPSDLSGEELAASKGRARGLTLEKVLIPRVYKWQHLTLIDVGWHLANMGLNVSILIDSQSELRSTLHARRCTRLTLREPVSDLRQMLLEFDAVLMGGSYPEGWGLLYEESIQAGCTPLVLANSGGLVEQWVRRRIGLITNPACAFRASLSIAQAATDTASPTAGYSGGPASPSVGPREELWRNAILAGTAAETRS